MSTSPSSSGGGTAPGPPTRADRDDPRLAERPILGIDLGLTRTGLARSDPGRKVAFGLPTFIDRPGRSLKRHLAALHREVPLGGAVLGLPLNMNGSPGELTPRVRRLGAWIEAELGIAVAYWDERLTTEAAIEILREARAGLRRDKGARDRIAAQLILREFLDAGCPFPEAS